MACNMNFLDCVDFETFEELVCHFVCVIVDKLQVLHGYVSFSGWIYDYVCIV